MLLSFLESWGRGFKNIYLVLGQVGAEVVEEIQTAFPNVDVVTLDTTISNKDTIRISQKMRFWVALADRLKAAHPFTIFADADTVLVKDVSGFCQGDIVITARSPKSQFIINSGVVGLSREALAAGLMQDWSKRNEAIIMDPALLAKATSRHEMYGGGDQMALIQMLGLDKVPQELFYNGLRVRTVPCDEFNACENKIYVDKARIYHLKASLQKFLLDRRPLIGPRRLEDSLAQLRAAIQANEAAVQRMLSLGIPPARVEKLYRFRLPRGIRRDLTLPSAIVALHRANARARQIVGTVLARLGSR